MKFNHLNVPNQWQHYWTRYPEGYTIVEALLSWVKQVDDMTDNLNSWNDYLDDFVGSFDKELQKNVTDILSEWQQSGFLEVVINEALDTKYHEMDNRLTAQMEKNALVDVANYCDVLDTATDNTQGILQAIEIVKTTNHKRLFFSPGVYAFSSTILIDNIDEINIELSPHAKLYDLGKDTETGIGTKRTPVGFIIRNVSQVSVNNLNHDCVVGPNTGSGYGQVLSAEDRTPQFSVEYAKKVTITGGVIEGQQGSIISEGSVNDANIMRDSYIRIYKCDDVDIHGVELADGVRGEYFGFYDCGNVLWYDCKHKQINADTFWSFGKVIQCEKLEMYGHDIVSDSTGSLVDIVVDNAVIRDMDVDYINGKFLDVSNEWENFVKVQNKITLKNCFSNGRGVQSTLASNDSNNRQINELILDNCLFGKEMSQGSLLSLTMFKKVVITGLSINNLRYTVDARSMGSTYTLFDREIVIKGIDFNQDVDAIYQNTIDAYGKLTFKNCSFNSNRANFEIKDKKAEVQGLTDLSQVTNPSQVVFENCIFDNSNMIMKANATFVNCELKNVTTTSVQNPWNAAITALNFQTEKYSPPTKDFYPAGFFVRSTNNNEYGAVGSKYAIFGWKRRTSGATHVLGTDWLEIRTLTGN